MLKNKTTRIKASTDKKLKRLMKKLNKGKFEKITEGQFIDEAINEKIEKDYFNVKL